MEINETKLVEIKMENKHKLLICSIGVNEADGSLTVELPAN